jgi:hypothetical protein
MNELKWRRDTPPMDGTELIVADYIDDINPESTKTVSIASIILK